MKDSEKDSIRRGISHHESRGLIEFASPPVVGNRTSKWKIKLRGHSDTLDLTWSEAKVMCVSLAAADTFGWNRCIRSMEELETASE